MPFPETFVDDGSLEGAVREIEEHAGFVREQIDVVIAENARLWAKLYKLGIYAAGLRRQLGPKRKKL
jgi:hypothetical protein